MFRDDMQSLFQLCGAYFHQDAFLDHPNADAIIQFYVESERAEAVRRASLDIEKLLSSPLDEIELRRILVSDLLCHYDACADGWSTYRAWLEHVKAILERRAIEERAIEDTQRAIE